MSAQELWAKLFEATKAMAHVPGAAVSICTSLNPEALNLMRELAEIQDLEVYLQPVGSEGRVVIIESCSTRQHGVEIRLQGSRRATAADLGVAA